MLCAQPSGGTGATIVAAAGRYADYRGRSIHDLGAPQIEADIRTALQERRNLYEHDRTVLYIHSPRGEDLVVHVATGRPLSELDRKLLEVFSINIAVGFDNAHMFETLEDLAYWDRLTRLPNRAAFEQEIERQGAEKPSFQVVVADIDNFQAVNDGLGHEIGDRTLQTAAGILRNVFGGGSFVARTSADTFAIIHGGSEEELEDRLRELHRRLEHNIVVDGNDIPLSMSVGVARYPDHGFLTEEEDSQLPANGPIIWVIDPIDGTTNYSRQIPEFCISIAACRPTPDGYEPLAAAIYDPMRDELFSAAKGLGATRQIGASAPIPMQVSTVADTTEAVMTIDWSASSRARVGIMSLVNKLAQDSFTLRAIGTAALAMAWVAAGRVDGYLNLRLRPWDVAAALLLLQESGGTIVQPSGEPIVWDTAGMACVATNGRLQLDL